MKEQPTDHQQAIRELAVHPDYFIVSDGAGGFQFVDPLSGDSLIEWPRVLDYDPISSSGRQYLYGSRHHIDVIGAYHRGAQDFDDIKREYDDLLQEVEIIGIEADWAAPDDLDTAQPGPDGVLIDKGSRGNFTKAQINWARQEDKLLLAYDIDGPNDPLRQSLKQLFHETIDPTRLGFGEQLTPQEQSQLGHICLGAYTMMRQHMMQAQLGFWLQRLVRQRRITTEDRVVMMIGDGHLPTIVDKINCNPGPRATGHVVEHRTVPTNPNTEAMELFRQMAETSRVTASQLQTIGSSSS